MTYAGYLLSEQSRVELMEIFTPLFPDVIGHHVTYSFGSDEFPPDVTSACVIGYIRDNSLECLVVSIDGNIHRPDGKIYHITWSLDRSLGRKPVDSNKVLQTKQFEQIPAINISIEPMVFT